MQFELKKYNRGTRKDYGNVSDGELIADLTHVAKKLNKETVTHGEYNLHGKFKSGIFGRRFGGWLEALKKAGLQRTRYYNVSDEDAFRNLENVWIKLGRQPKREDLLKPLSEYSGAFYEYRFGTWGNALEKFIVYINKEKEGSSAEIKNNKCDSGIQLKTKRSISLQLRFAVMKRDGFKCQKCGRSPATDSGVILHIDHKVPYSKGGETVFDNLQTLCSKCNIGKSDLKIDES